MPNIDPIALSQALIRCPSVTPTDAGVLAVLEEALSGLDFTCHRMTFGEGEEAVDNLYARLGDAAPNLCFAGHTDVVPAGDSDAWSVDPFAAEIRDDVLIGRGAVDMKTAVAAWVAAVSNHLEASGTPAGSLSLLITNDEEGPGTYGTRKVLEWLEEQGESLDACIIGEPTNPTTLGEMVKIGRRGSLDCHLTVTGVQGHTAYPDQAKNPITDLVKILNVLQSQSLDEGTEHFQPSNFEISNIDVGNKAGNVIPAQARARFNIRYNDTHTAESLTQWIEDICRKNSELEYGLDARSSADAFVTEPGPLSDIVVAAVEKVTSRTPELSTSGGTSDARFIKDVCPLVECGLINATAHKVDEQIAVADIHALTQIYQEIIAGYFA